MAPPTSHQQSIFVRDLERAMGQAECNPTTRNRHPSLLDLRVPFTRAVPFGACLSRVLCAEKSEVTPCLHRNMRSNRLQYIRNLELRVPPNSSRFLLGSLHTDHRDSACTADTAETHYESPVSRIGSHYRYPPTAIQHAVSQYACHLRTRCSGISYARFMRTCEAHSCWHSNASSEPTKFPDLTTRTPALYLLCYINVTIIPMRVFWTSNNIPKCFRPFSTPTQE
eukprot:511457-Prorocentrum_minimum.AAC.6